MVEALAGRGADVNATSNNGETAIMYAANQGHTAVVEALAGRGADVNAADNNGETAMMFAADQGHTDTVKALQSFNLRAVFQQEEGHDSHRRSCCRWAHYNGRGQGHAQDRTAT